MDNIKKICRLCLKETIDEEIIEIYKNDASKYNLVDIINKYFNIEISENDNFSKIICKTCSNKLDSFYYFIETVKYNNDILIKNSGRININFKNSENEMLDTIYINKEILENGKNTENNDIATKELESTTENMSVIEPDVILETSNDSSESETYKAKKRKTGNGSYQKYSETPNDIQIKKFYKYECHLCKDHPEITTFRNYKTHYKKKHGITAYIKCCGKKFNRAYALVEHIDEHLMPNSLICPTCNKKLRTKQTLLLHMDTHVPIEQRPLKCKFCDVRFVRKHFLLQHERIHLSDDELKFICDLCGKKFPTDWRLKTHLNNTHSDEKPFVCEICAKCFKLKVQLRNHMYIHNSKEEIHKQCEICGIRLKSPRSYYSHMREKHDDSKPKSFPCDKCSHICPTRKALYAHTLNKHGPKKLNCIYCMQAFSSSSLLKSHMIKHTGPGEPLKCPFCPKEFSFRSGYYSHKKKVHPDMTQPSKISNNK